MSNFNKDPRLVNLRKSLMEVYFSAHKPWIQWIINNAQEAVFKMLDDSPWNESNVQTLVWEGKQIVHISYLILHFKIYYYY